MGLFGFTPDCTTSEEKLRDGLAKKVKGATSETLEAIYEAFCERIEFRLKRDLESRFDSEFKIKASFEKLKMTPQERQKAKEAEAYRGATGSNGYPKRWDILRSVAHSAYGSANDADVVIKQLWETFKQSL